MLSLSLSLSLSLTRENVQNQHHANHWNGAVIYTLAIGLTALSLFLSLSLSLSLSQDKLCKTNTMQIIGMVQSLTPWLLDLLLLALCFSKLGFIETEMGLNNKLLQ